MAKASTRLVVDWISADNISFLSDFSMPESPEREDKAEVVLSVDGDAYANA
jgi:hypothetical protein